MHKIDRYAVLYLQMEELYRFSPMSTMLNNNFDNISVQPVASAPVKI